MLNKKLIIAAAAMCALAGGSVLAQSTGGSSTAATPSSSDMGASKSLLESTTSAHRSVISMEPVYTDSMKRLQESADRLRQSIQALAQKPPGPDRDRALSEARHALQRTQQAMIALPPGLRSTGMVSTGDYDKSVRKLMSSADSLRHSIQEMAQQPGGERRNRAIDQANRALLDTQAAMVAAYESGTSTKSSSNSSSTQSMGAAANAAPRQGETQSSRQKAHSDASSSSSVPATSEAVLVLLPSMQAQGTRLAGGCWVRFFDGEGFKGATLTLAGPVDLPRMELGNAWRDWDSAIVGPKATVRAFDNENFADHSAVLRAGQSIRDLHDKKLGWVEEVKSARVTCS